MVDFYCEKNGHILVENPEHAEQCVFTDDFHGLVHLITEYGQQWLNTESKLTFQKKENHLKANILDSIIRVNNSFSGIAEKLIYANDIVLHNLFFRKSITLHGAALLNKEHAVFLLGHSDAGKTTLSRQMHSSGYFEKVVDDQLTFHLTDNSFSFSAAPWDACFSGKYYAPTKIDTFFLSGFTSDLPDLFQVLEYCVKPQNYQVIFEKYASIIEKYLPKTNTFLLKERDTENSIQHILKQTSTPHPYCK